MDKPHSDDIHINVKTAFIAEQSEIADDRYVFSYTITIKNNGHESAQLLNRHWVITDANGNTQEVKGEGVIGEQPHIKPGESYQYTSGTILKTPIGSMHGEYEMSKDNGSHFMATIAPFSLAYPRALH